MCSDNALTARLRAMHGLSVTRLGNVWTALFLIVACRDPRGCCSCHTPWHRDSDVLSVNS